jgi:hypothetical protein
MVMKPAQTAEASMRAGLTLEPLLYALLFLIALGIRLLGLGSAQSLSSLEAVQAWPAWLDAMNRQIPILSPAQSPLLYSAQRTLFWLTGGGGELWARIFPALAGSLLVLVPWGLRRQVGRGGALILALLFTVDPWLLVFSRLGDGAILSVVTGLVVWIVLLNGQSLSTLQRRLAMVAAALFLISGPLAWLLLPILLATALLYPPAFPEDRRERSWLAILFAGTLVLAATGWLAYWQGLGILSHSLTVAFSFLAGESSYPLVWPWLRLLVDQPLLVVFGLTGIGFLWAGQSSPDRRWAILLTGWLIYAGLILLLPGRNPITLLLVALPLSLAAASLVARLLRFCTTETDWQDGALIAITLGVLLVTSFFLTANYLRPGDSDPRLLLFYLILPVLVAFFIWWSGWRTTAQITGLVTVTIFFLVTLSSARMLTLHGDLVRGNQLFAETTQPGVRLLAEDVAHLSAIRLGDPGQAVVLAQVDPELQPSIGWHLRFVRDLRFLSAVDPNSLDGRTFVITGADGQPPLPDRTIGSRYAVRSRWLPTDLEEEAVAWGLSPRLLRWFLFRELRELPPRESVVLWVQEE